MRASAVGLGLVAAAAGAQTVRNPDTVAPPVGRYSHLAVVPAGADLLFLAGQVGNRRDGSVPTDIDDQYEQAMRNVAAILASEGATPANLVKVTIYATGPLDRDRAVKARRAVFAPGQNWATISVAVAPDLVVEANEEFLVNLVNPSGGAVLGTASAFGRIINDDVV
mgnify:CR=1 FL=1